MKSSRSHKKIEKSQMKNDIIISDDIEPTESYAGVGDDNIVKFINNENIVNSHTYIKKLNSNKSYYTKPKTPDFFLNKSVDVKLKYISDDLNNDINCNRISKKKIKFPTVENKSNNEQRFPQLSMKSAATEREYMPEGISTINNQIEKLEYRKLKLTMSERKARMKDLLGKGKQNWSKFKSEINFIKSVELTPDNNLTNETENMIKDEKLLNVILNDIVIGEKENFQNKLPCFDFNGNMELEINENADIVKEINHQIENEIQFTSVIKMTRKTYDSHQLTDEMAMNLKHILFNSTCRSWGSEWYKQNIEFYPVDSEMPFGIIQKNQGPNNIMVVVQAEFLTEALFFSNSDVNWINNIKKNRNKIVSDSLSNIISRCRIRDSDPFKICLLDTNLKGRSMGVVKSDGITECLVFYEIFCIEELKNFIFSNINQFIESCNPGLILIVVSCLMTHGLDNCKNQLSSKTERLINPLGVSSDELMNLLIHGTINSHYFNDKLEIIDAESGQSDILYGVMKRSSIGFLSLNAHCEYCKQIGTYLKTPKYPVWIVKWRNDNYCVLYCSNKTLISDWKAEIRFVLHLYSPIFKDKGSVRLTIDSSPSQIEKQNNNKDELKRKLEIENQAKQLTEERLKNMSENTLKFILDNRSIDEYMNEGVEEHPIIESDFQYLNRIINTKWPNATLTLDSNQLNISNLFKN